jgi:peptidoglycan/LPS O-acetylase OafA/YrhL
MSRLHYRPDIDGLRAAAVVGVVFFHAGVPEFRGGFAGVDIFFVISGYLITSLLFLELDRTDFLAFWARRTRRILPSALLVVAATLAGAYAIVSTLDLYYAARDAIYAALYIINWEQLAASLDYFTDAGHGLYVHYWSLAVEEQFYLFLTLVFAAALGSSRLGARKLPWTGAKVAIALLAVLGVLSFVANLV